MNLERFGFVGGLRSANLLEGEKSTEVGTFGKAHHVYGTCELRTPANIDRWPCLSGSLLHSIRPGRFALT